MRNIVKAKNSFTEMIMGFKEIFHGETFESYSKECLEVIGQDVASFKNNTFKERLKVKSNDNILATQRKLKTNQIGISDLTDEELDRVIELYKKQINEKKIFTN